MVTIKQLEHLLIERSIKSGHFILASGKTSNFYIDARLTTMSPEGMTLIGELALIAMNDKGWSPDAVGGLTLGADPVAFSISFSSAAQSHPVRAFTVRKEPKQHGTGNLIEGPFKSGDKVVIVEDVITTGSSALRAIDAVDAAGAIILGVLAIVNRDEGGIQAILNRGYETITLTSIQDLLK